MNSYNYPDTVPDPGLFEHRSGDCATHGANVVFARPKGSCETPLCVECMLETCEVSPVTAKPESSF